VTHILIMRKLQSIDDLLGHRVTDQWRFPFELCVGFRNIDDWEIGRPAESCGLHTLLALFVLRLQSEMHIPPIPRAQYL
jgi:hypothetical protein